MGPERHELTDGPAEVFRVEHHGDLVAATEWLGDRALPAKIPLTSPDGRPFTQHGLALHCPVTHYDYTATYGHVIVVYLTDGKVVVYDLAAFRELVGEPDPVDVLADLADLAGDDEDAGVPFS